MSIGRKKDVEATARILDERVSAGMLLARKFNDFYRADLDDLEERAQAWHKYNQTLLPTLFSGDIDAEYRLGSVPMRGGYSSEARAHDAAELLRRRCGKLKSIIERLELLETADSPSKDVVISNNDLKAAMNSSSSVFLVHGHDNSTKFEVARFIENELGLKVIILHEQASRSMTLIEKLEKYASQAAYAVILLTPDDEGRSLSGGQDLERRARQNVILELGYFIARLGRENVTALLSGDMDKPSDIDGVVYISLSGNWQVDLTRELQAAGHNVSL